MRIAFLAAGAAGMYCGSCLRDNAVASALKSLGHEVFFIPLYTPLKLDTESVAEDTVFYGGINVYLQQKSGVFRKTPRALDWIFDTKPVLSLSSKLAGMTKAADLGELTVSMLKGEGGHQRKELERLAEYLRDIKPEIINLPNSMFVGTAREIRKSTHVPIICSLTGEDLFLEGMIEPYKTQALALLRDRAKDVDGFVATSRYYADFMSDYLQVPREKIDVVPIGINPDAFGRQFARPTNPFTIGYLARIAPEKGLHVLCEAFKIFKELPGTESARLRAAGYLGPSDRAYFEKIRAQMKSWGLADSFDYAGEVSFEEKLRFLDTLSVFSVPTVYHEPKGLFVLEALAHGIPVVQPNHGAFPELIEGTGGGFLFEPEDPEDLANKLHQLMCDPEAADRFALRGQESVRRKFTAIEMGRTTLSIYENHRSMAS